MQPYTKAVKDKQVLFQSTLKSTGNPIDSALVVARITIPNESDTTLYPVISFEDLGEGLYKLVYTPTNLGSFNIMIIATDVVDPNNPVINQEFFIRTKHSFFVGENLKPVCKLRI